MKTKGVSIALAFPRLVIPAHAGIQVADSVRHTVGKRYPGYGEGMDPGFHRGDDKAWIPAFAGMTEARKIILLYEFSKESLIVLLNFMSSPSNARRNRR